MGTFIVLGIVLAVVMAIIQAVSQSKSRDEMRQSMAASGFNASQQFMSQDARTGIGVDHAQRLACLTVAGQAARTIRYRDLLEVEVLEDGSTVTKTSRSSQAGRAIVGGLLLGPLGLLAGALTAKKYSENKVRRVDVKLLVNDPGSPVHVINFLNSSADVDKGSHQYKTARKQADHWYGALLACIKQADADDTAMRPVAALPPIRSVGDELAKLADLRSRGILTDAEFAEQKALVLGGR